MLRLLLSTLLLCQALCQAARAADVQVAVAANFTAPMQEIARLFEADTGHHVTLVSGSTGKFYTQISNGAPFEVLLAADQDTPLRLERELLAAPDSRYTYATGKLVLWSSRAGYVDARGAILKQGDFVHLSLANPKLAPYGAAGVETLRKLGLWERLAARVVQAENIAQAQQFIASGNAELGFIAMSQVYKDGKLGSGSAWVVPTGLYRPLHQDVVLLARGRHQPAAVSLMAYLRSPKALAVIRSYGYEASNPAPLPR